MGMNCAKADVWEWVTNGSINWVSKMAGVIDHCRCGLCMVCMPCTMIGAAGNSPKVQAVHAVPGGAQQAAN
jgi:aminopeptidase-like protein